MRTGEAEFWLRQELTGIYDSREAANIADRVMEHVTGLSRLDRVTRRDDPLVVQQLHHLTECHHRLMHHEPVQYVLNEAPFYDLNLFVDNNVLIPRPETEELVHWIISDVKALGLDVFDRKLSEADETTLLKILDVGTGSGCIALALKKAMPRAEVWGCDVNDNALNVARRNGSELDIRVDFLGLDFLDKAQRRQLPQVDIVVSNPPYVPEKDKTQMRANVLDHEPHTALFVPDTDALRYYKALAAFGKTSLHANGHIYVEIHENMGAQVVELFEKEGYHPVELRKDMQGADRLVKARVPAGAAR